jgi:carbon storage regulator
VLVLTRKIGERIVIDNRIVIEVVALKGHSIRLGIDAPAELQVLREELVKTDKTVDRSAPIS